MNNAIRVTMMALSMSLGVAAYPAHADIKFPKVGATATWECSGPYGSKRTSKVVRVEKGIIRSEGYTSGRGETFVEDTLLGIGTTLSKKRDRGDGKGVRGQKYDEDDFRDYEKLEPGSKFRGVVSEWHNRGSWDWRYTIEIGDPKTINHKVFGEIQVVPVLEKRTVIGGNYSSKMRVLVYPELGLELNIIYKDGKRDYKCDVTAYEQHLIPDLDIYRSANVLVKHHGQDAPIQATMRRQREQHSNFRLWLQADLKPTEIEVRSTPNSGHFEAHAELPFVTQTV